MPEGFPADRPGSETDLTDREPCAAEGSTVHCSSSSASFSGVETGSEHDVPTHTVALGAAVFFFNIVVRGPDLCRAVTGITHTGPASLRPDTLICVFVPTAPY